MLLKASFILAPRIREGLLPEGEARGGGFALSELPHPFHGLLLIAKIGFIPKSTSEKRKSQPGTLTFGRARIKL